MGIGLALSTHRFDSGRLHKLVDERKSIHEETMTTPSPQTGTQAPEESKKTLTILVECEGLAAGWNEIETDIPIRNIVQEFVEEDLLDEGDYRALINDESVDFGNTLKECNANAGDTLKFEKVEDDTSGK
jgi:hypothetical protein